MLNKKENGITLVALVITIIVLLILAGITINFAIGQNGIIEKAKAAKDNMDDAQIEEEFSLLIAEAKIRKEKDDNFNFKEYIANNGAEIDEKDGTYTVSYKGKEYELDSNTLDIKEKEPTVNKLYLYKEGTENATISGWSDNGGTNYSKETNHIYLRLKDDTRWASHSAAIKFSDLITSEYKHLVIELEDMYCDSSDVSLFVTYNEWIPTENYDDWIQTYDGTGKRTLDINIENKNLTEFIVGWCCSRAEYFMAKNWGSSDGASGEAYFKLKNVYLY